VVKKNRNHKDTEFTEKKNKLSVLRASVVKKKIKPQRHREITEKKINFVFFVPLW
jgi:hypothetical protein